MNSPLAQSTQSLLFRICMLTLIMCSVHSTAGAEFQKTKIAVLDFEPIGEKLDTSDMGTILSEWFITGLVKSGRFDVVERTVLKKIVAEQGLSASGRIDEHSAGKLGNILGVKVIIAGSVVKNKGVIAMNSRVINVENGSIVASENIHGKADSDLHALTSELTGKIMRSFPLTGYVVKRSEKSVVIDIGLDSGLGPGTDFIVYREGEVIKHPKTGEVLDVEQIEIGRLRIDRMSRNVAEGVIVDEQPGTIQTGDLVKSVQKK